MRDENFIKIKQIVNLTLFISIAILLSVFEAYIPILSFAIPGVKLGLSNVILLLILPYYKFQQLLIFQFLKVTISTFILGIFSVYLFSLVASIVALVVMYLVYRAFSEHISIYSLSILGSISHNVTQLILAMIYVKSIYLYNYLNVLVISGFIMGLIIAYISDKKLSILKRKLINDSFRKF